MAQEGVHVLTCSFLYNLSPKEDDVELLLGEFGRRNDGPVPVGAIIASDLRSSFSPLLCFSPSIHLEPSDASAFSVSSF